MYLNLPIGQSYSNWMCTEMWIYLRNRMWWFGMGPSRWSSFCVLSSSRNSISIVRCRFSTIIVFFVYNPRQKPLIICVWSINCSRFIQLLRFVFIYLRAEFLAGCYFFYFKMIVVVVFGSIILRRIYYFPNAIGCVDGFRFDSLVFGLCLFLTASNPKRKIYLNYFDVLPFFDRLTFVQYCVR